MPRHRAAILVGSDVRVGLVLQLLQVRRKIEERYILAGLVLQLLQVRRKIEERYILAACQASRGDSRVRKVFPKVEQQNDDGVDNYGDIYGFAAARTREIVLQLDEQMRHAGIVIQIAIGRFPSLGIVEPELLRLRLLGRRHWILEWNLCNRHELSLCELGLSVRHTFP